MVDCGNEVRLFFLKSLASELQCPAVLGDSSHDVIGRPLGNLGFHLKRDLHCRADQP
jgi:hypothetical protein